MESHSISPVANPKSELSLAMPVWLVLFARAILSGLGFILLLTNRVPLSEDGTIRPYFGIDPVVPGLSGALLGVWQRFDAIHYIRIASTGYSATDLTVFFPLYPLFIRVLGTLLGKNYLLAGLLISNVAAILAVLLFYRLVFEEFDDQGLAKRAITYLVFFPTGFFLLVPYTESLTLLFTILSIYEARHGRWVTAGISGLACSLSRPQGVLVSILLAAEAIRQYRHGVHPPVSSLLALSLPPVGLTAFLAWRSIAGFPPMNAVQYTHWQRITTIPFAVVLETFQRIAMSTATAIEYLDLAIIILMLLLGVRMLKRLPLPFVLYFWVALIFNLSQFRIPQPISSQARFALLLFPAFIILGQLGASPRNHRLILYSFFALWIYLAGQFIMWGWVG
jgi:Gpi18-like mannosyltransferase